MKPCYLFALVAGDLAHSEDCFTTMSGRKVALRIFVQHKNISKVDFAMQSLKHAMRWDEVRQHIWLKCLTWQRLLKTAVFCTC